MIAQDIINHTDFNLINCRYYSGEKKAPVLTIFIGGNHEASNHLQELPYGGWVAPNIYFLGRACRSSLYILHGFSYEQPFNINLKLYIRLRRERLLCDSIMLKCK